MRFFTLFAGVAAAATIAQRDLATVEAALQSIADATTTLTNEVNGFQGAGQVASLQQASANLITVINTANGQVAATTPLTGDEAIQLIDPIRNLNDQVTTAVDAVIAKKDLLVSTGIGSIVYDQLVMIRDAAATFSATTVSKVPAPLQETARQLAQPISDNLDRAVAAFADQAQPTTSPTSSGPVPTSTGSIPVYPYPTPSGYPTAPGYPTETVPSYPTYTAAPGYPSESAPVYPPTYPSGPAYYPPVANGTATAVYPVYTGAAAKSATGFGVAAVAALAAIAAF